MAKEDFSQATLRKSVRRAREILQREAMDIVEKHLQTIDLAIADEQYEFALKAQQWLIEHIADDDGIRVVDPSVDKIVEQKGPLVSPVQIGIQLGGVPQQQLAPANANLLPIVEAKVEEPTANIVTASEPTKPS